MIITSKILRVKPKHGFRLDIVVLVQCSKSCLKLRTMITILCFGMSEVGYILKGGKVEHNFIVPFEIY